MTLDFQQTTQRYIPVDRKTLHNHLCENLTSCEHKAGLSLLLVDPLIFLMSDDYNNDDDDDNDNNSRMIIYLTEGICERRGIRKYQVRNIHSLTELSPS
jgi:hypothetical protein